MEMSKLLIIHRLNDENDRPALERWFHRYHVPEVLTQCPWTVKYLLYRVVPPPVGGESYGFFNYRVHENWVLDKTLRRGEKGLLSMTTQPGACDAIVVNMPAEPTEDFKGAEASFESHTILRWIMVFRYPDNVAIEDGEAWYLNTHVPEVLKQPGLTRFFSTKAYVAAKRPLPQSEFTAHDPLFYKQWHRVSELWFENNQGWVDSIINRPPSYTKPPWSNWDAYPFFVPGEELVTTFILERPDNDFTREYRALYL